MTGGRGIAALYHVKYDVFDKTGLLNLKKCVIFIKNDFIKTYFNQIAFDKRGNGHVYWKREGITISAGVLQ